MKIYQVKLFQADNIQALENMINQWLKTLPFDVDNNKAPSTRLADSGNVAMVIYQTDSRFT